EPASEVNPLVVEAMAEVGLDLSRNKPQGVFELFKARRLYDYVITVCDDGAEKGCPVFPGMAQRWHWPFPDPALALGTHEEQLAEVRRIRDLIRERIQRPFNASFTVQDPFDR
ncbi:MAG: arsenate reductase ArsC, partial [Humidesulfovibrio sp.]|nr:arsenate reductase ArsC [Humidesulfovibrio sp.]